MVKIKKYLQKKSIYGLITMFILYRAKDAENKKTYKSILWLFRQ